MENLEVVRVTVAQSVDAQLPFLLVRQLRLCLIAAEDSDIPGGLTNIIVHIHAITTFQALHEYLRTRVSGVMLSSSRLSGMLAALAASGLAPESSRAPLEEPPKPPTAPSSALGDDSRESLDRRRSLPLSSKVARQGATHGSRALQ
ncbi:hypothetical protein NLI96_g12516 [Meripilus lineatus]|uniref:Uncharacterized protein n=1 Tax=Meripilus lineatus TaxID=2056292 RepID=A0AAD5YCB6_9APHY|nr:hypothetical protein NLI96_g12516 [Physisporinus lineatus]